MQVDPNAPVEKVYLVAGTDAFVFVVERPYDVPATQKRTWYNGLDHKVIDGDVMAFDSQTGQPMWSCTAQVRQEALMYSQPTDVPVIPFVGFYRGQDSTGSKPLMSVLLLEKSSGRILFADDKMQNTGNLCVVTADESTHEVSMDMVNRSVKLKFTDLPRPPEPPATLEAEVKDQRGPQGLNRILERFLEGSK